MDDSTVGKTKWRRHFLGGCSIVLLVTAGVLMTNAASGASYSVAGGCMRIGLLLGAIWLAWPQAAELTARTPGWLLVSILVCFGVAVVRPKLIPLLLPFVLALLALNWAGIFFRPKD